MGVRGHAPPENLFTYVKRDIFTTNLRMPLVKRWLEDRASLALKTGKMVRELLIKIIVGTQNGEGNSLMKIIIGIQYGGPDPLDLNLYEFSVQV